MESLAQFGAIRGGVPLGGGDKAQVTVGQVQCAVAVETAQHRNINRFNGLSHPKDMLMAGHVIEHDSGQLQVGIKVSVAQSHRSCTTGQAGHVHDQHDRRTEQFGYLSRAAGLTLAGEAIVQAHNAFDESYVSLGRGAGKEISHRGRGYHPGVQVARGPAGGHIMVAGINVVRADFKRSDPIALSGQSGHQPGGHGRFAYPAGRPGNDQARNPDAHLPYLLGSTVGRPLRGWGKITTSAP